MAEYIEREAAQTSCRKYSFAESYDAFAVDCILKAIPAADVATVRHGRWIKESDGGTRCSVCNKRVIDVTGGWYEPVDMSDMPYCPKCGAKMEGGAEDASV